MKHNVSAPVVVTIVRSRSARAEACIVSHGPGPYAGAPKSGPDCKTNQRHFGSRGSKGGAILDFGPSHPETIRDSGCSHPETIRRSLRHT